MRRHLLAIATLGAMAGCFFPADRGRLLEDRVNSLSDQNEKLRDRLAETQRQLDETVNRLQITLDQLDRASRTTGANIGVRVDATMQDIAALRGQIESYQYKIQELEAKLATSPAPASGSAVESKTEELKKPSDPKEFLRLAEAKAKAGEHDTARHLFAEFLKKWDRDEGVGEAHFGLGEVYFGEQKCREALYEFGKVIQDHPKTPSAPLAYLRSSDCFRQIKMTAEAKIALEELVRLHPKSDAAKSARQKLSELEKKTAAGRPAKK